MPLQLAIVNSNFCSQGASFRVLLLLSLYFSSLLKLWDGKHGKKKKKNITLLSGTFPKRKKYIYIFLSSPTTG